MPEIDETLEFLQTWKTRREIEAKFQLSNTSSYNLVNSLLGRNLIETWQVRESEKTGRTWYYRAKVAKQR